MIRILLADDHAIVRHGLKALLLAKFKNAFISEAASGQEALDEVWKQRLDLVLLDLSMPGRSGVELIEEIKRARPQLPVLVLSAHVEEQYGLRVIQAGAAGFLNKAHACADLITAVSKILAGELYITESLAAKMAVDLAKPGSASPHQRLSVREFQILQAIGAGRSAKEICSELSLSPGTVSTYRARLLKKMGLKTTAQLIKYAVENKLSE